MVVPFRGVCCLKKFSRARSKAWRRHRGKTSHIAGSHLLLILRHIVGLFADTAYMFVEVEIVMDDLPASILS